MVKLNTLFLLFFMIWLGQLFGQENNISSKNSVSLELGGNGFFYSCNYERLLKARKNKLSGRLGLMYIYSFQKNNRFLVGFPVEISQIREIKKKLLEFGLGLTGIYDHYYSTTAYPTSTGDSIVIGPDYQKEFVFLCVLRLGYRFQKPDSHIFYKIGITPLAGIIIDPNEDRAYRYKFKWIEKFAYPWIGAGIGWTIKSKQ